MNAPCVWLLIADKLGDNMQVELIAEGLGWPRQRKRLVFRDPYVKGKPRFVASLHHVDLKASDALEPPWPDFVITIGRRPSMAAMWVRRQSGGRTRVILLGRPKRFFDELALVISSGQYRLPQRPNVLHLDLPLLRIDEAAIAMQASAWRARMATMGRPLTALLVGGPTSTFVLDARVAGRLIAQARHLSAKSGGSLYVVTSRRTPPEVVAALGAGLPPDARLYRWIADGAQNPYRALLGLADRFIVTGDSVSMMVEVARLGKPLVIFPLPNPPGIASKLGRLVNTGFVKLCHPSEKRDERGGALQLVGDWLYRLGLVRYSRDVSAIHRILIERGAAAEAGDPFPLPRPGVADELPRVLERIRSLV